MPSLPLLLAIDQGTTNTKALLVDRGGQPVFRTAVPMTLSTPQPDFVEQDAEAIWQSVNTAALAAIEYAREQQADIEGIAISNQRETAIAWHRETGKPLAPAVSWQCRRSIPICQKLAQHQHALRRSTGLPLDPVLSATKWAWMLQNVPAVQEAAVANRLCLGTVESWLIYKLSGGRVHATDLTNASRTGLLHLETLTWNVDLLASFGIPETALPELRASSGIFATCSALRELEGVPVASAIGDSHAAMAGHGAFTPGTIKATYGTGSSLMTLTPALVEDTPHLARTIAWSFAEETQYAVEGNIFMTGSGVQWVGEFLGLPEPAAGAWSLAERVPNGAGAYFVPAMAGLGAPYWSAEAQGLLCNLQRTHTAAHMARAAVEAIAFQVADVFFAMQQTAGTSLSNLRADGGATRNSRLMQLQADLLDAPVLRSHQEELSAMGAAYLAGLALNWWPTLESIAALPRGFDRIVPTMASTQRKQLYAGWQQAVRRTRTQTETQA